MALTGFKYADPMKYAGLGSDIFNYQGGPVQDQSAGLSGEYKNLFLFQKAMKGDRETTAEQLEALKPFMLEMEKARVENATKLARGKLADEALFSGIGALGKGVQTAVAGGSPEMLAYMSQAPMRRFSEYQAALGAYARPNLPAFAPSNYVSPRYFG